MRTTSNIIKSSLTENHDNITPEMSQLLQIKNLINSKLPVLQKTIKNDVFSFISKNTFNQVVDLNILNLESKLFGSIRRFKQFSAELNFLFHRLQSEIKCIVQILSRSILTNELSKFISNGIVSSFISLSSFLLQRQQYSANMLQKIQQTILQSKGEISSKNPQSKLCQKCFNYLEKARIEETKNRILFRDKIIFEYQQNSTNQKGSINEKFDAKYQATTLNFCKKIKNSIASPISGDEMKYILNVFESDLEKIKCNIKECLIEVGDFGSELIEFSAEMTLANQKELIQNKKQNSINKISSDLKPSNNPFMKFNYEKQIFELGKHFHKAIKGIQTEIVNIKRRFSSLAKEFQIFLKQEKQTQCNFKVDTYQKEMIKHTIQNSFDKELENQKMLFQKQRDHFSQKTKKFEQNQKELHQKLHYYEFLIQEKFKMHQLDLNLSNPRDLSLALLVAKYEAIINQREKQIKQMQQTLSNHKLRSTVSMDEMQNRLTTKNVTSTPEKKLSQMINHSEKRNFDFKKQISSKLIEKRSFDIVPPQIDDFQDKNAEHFQRSILTNKVNEKINKVNEKLNKKKSSSHSKIGNFQDQKYSHSSFKSQNLSKVLKQIKQKTSMPLTSKKDQLFKVRAHRTFSQKSTSALAKLSGQKIQNQKNKDKQGGTQTKTRLKAKTVKSKLKIEETKTAFPYSNPSKNNPASAQIQMQKNHHFNQPSFLKSQKHSKQNLTNKVHAKALIQKSQVQIINYQNQLQLPPLPSSQKVYKIKQLEKSLVLPQNSTNKRLTKKFGKRKETSENLLKKTFVPMNLSHHLGSSAKLKKKKKQYIIDFIPKIENQDISQCRLQFQELVNKQVEILFADISKNKNQLKIQRASNRLQIPVYSSRKFSNPKLKSHNDDKTCLLSNGQIAISTKIFSMMMAIKSTNLSLYHLIKEKLNYFYQIKKKIKNNYDYGDSSLMKSQFSQINSLVTINSNESSQIFNPSNEQKNKTDDQIQNRQIHEIQLTTVIRFIIGGHNILCQNSVQMAQKNSLQHSYTGHKGISTPDRNKNSCKHIYRFYEFLSQCSKK